MSKQNELRTECNKICEQMCQTILDAIKKSKHGRVSVLLQDLDHKIQQYSVQFFGILE